MENIVLMGAKGKISPYLIDQLNDPQLAAKWDEVREFFETLNRK